MSKITVIPYDDKYVDGLEELLLAFSKEIYGAGTVDLNRFVEDHWFIYLAMDGEKVVGFSSYIYNTYFGLRPPTIGNSYVYVTPQYRGGRAAYLLSKQTGYVSIDTGLPLELYLASNESRRVAEHLIGTKGNEVYTAHIYELDHIKQGYKFYTK
jgi:hypothetical protein